jgi:hypothetical protein
MSTNARYTYKIEKVSVTHHVEVGDKNQNPTIVGLCTTLAARGREELFFCCLRKVSPAHQCSVGVWYIVQEFGW